MEKKYVFIKPFTNENGTIPQGSEIVLFRGFVYINGGICMGVYANILRELIENEKLRTEYLREFKIEKNEF